MSEVNTEQKRAVLTDPYKNYQGETARLQSDVPAHLRMRLRSICPDYGFMQAMMNTFFESVIDEMEKRNIQTYEQSDELIAIIRRRTAKFTPGGGHLEAGGGGTPEVHATTPNAPKQRPDVKGKVGVGRKKTNAKDGKGD